MRGGLLSSSEPRKNNSAHCHFTKSTSPFVKPLLLAHTVLAHAVLAYAVLTYKALTYAVLAYVVLAHTAPTQRPRNAHTVPTQHSRVRPDIYKMSTIQSPPPPNAATAIPAFSTSAKKLLKTFGRTVLADIAFSKRK